MLQPTPTCGACLHWNNTLPTPLGGVETCIFGVCRAADHMPEWPDKPLTHGLTPCPSPSHFSPASSSYG